MPFSLRLYLAVSWITAPLWWMFLRRQVTRNKVDSDRIAEYFGTPSRPRPPGQLLWFHASSVGESLALLTLLRHLRAQNPDLGLLLTTTTRGSHDALVKAGLPDGVIHQYTVIDTPQTAARFLTHWSPTALILAEVDLWPATLRATVRRGIPLAQINVVIPAARFARWQRRSRTYRYLLGLFDRVLVQDAATLDRIVTLGAEPARVQVMGVLKAASDPLPDLAMERAAVEAQLGTRPRWLAASTRTEEEPQILEAHKIALQQMPDLLLILAPRTPQRADETEAAARAAGLTVTRRSTGGTPDAGTQVYIADTLGEMGLWYRVSPVSFIGNSFAVAGMHMTGKNPYEAMALGSVVLHGPMIGNFVSSYETLHAADAALETPTPDDLAAAVVRLQNPAARAPYLNNAARVQAENTRPLAVALDAVHGLIAAHRAG